MLCTVKALSEWFTDTEEKSGSGWVSGYSRQDAGEESGKGQPSLSQRKEGPRRGRRANMNEQTLTRI